jgi:hypothetical protein
MSIKTNEWFFFVFSGTSFKAIGRVILGFRKIFGLKFYFQFFAVFLIQGCSFSEAKYLPEREVVLHPGMQVLLRDPESENELLIACKKSSQRELTMNGSKRIVKVQNRASRWYGSYGVYSASRWRLFDSIRLRTHITYQEGIRHFCNLEEALMWIRQAQSYSSVFYNSEGVLIGIRHTKEKNLWDIDLYRICIAGNVPENLPGASGYVELSGGDGFPKCYALNGFKPSEPKTVIGVYFTGRALDLMNEHGCGCDDVVEAIRKGEVKTYSEDRKVYEYGPMMEDYSFINPFRSMKVFVDGEGRVEYIDISPMWEKGWDKQKAESP